MNLTKTEEYLLKLAMHSKTASLSNLINEIQPWSLTKKVGKGLGTALGLTGLAYPVEQTFRTGANVVNGKYEIAGAPTTSSAVSGLLNSLLGVSHIGPAISGVTKHVTDGVLQSDAANTMMVGANNAMDKANKFITSPNAGKAVSALSQGAEGLQALTKDDVMPNVAMNLQNYAREGASAAAEGAMKGMAKSTFTDPKVMAASLAMGTAPFMINDLMTKKRRQEQAKVNHLILQRLANPPVEKNADWKGMLSQLAEHPFLQRAGKVQPPAEVWEALKSKMDSPGGVNTHDLSSVLNKWRHNTLFDNPLTRNPVKSTMAVGALNGIVGGANKTIHEMEANPDDGSSLKGAVGVLSGMGKGVVQPYIDLEHALIKGVAPFVSGNLNNTQGGEHLKQTLSNFKNLADNTKGVMQENMAKNVPESLSAPQADPGFFAKYKEPLKWYGAGAAALAMPFGVHKLINRQIDKSVYDRDAKSEKLKQRLLV